MQNIGLYTIASGIDLAETTKEIFKEEESINFAGHFNTFNEVTKLLISTPIKEPLIFIIRDYSFKKEDVLNFVNQSSDISALSHYKKILYTKSINKNYINNLSNSNINGILHKLDTPLFVKQNRYLPELKQVKEKLIKILKLVSDGGTYYDSEITQHLPKKHAWARNETKAAFDTPVTEAVLSWQTPENTEKMLQETIPLIKLLSLREKEILLLIAEGRKNIEIAKQLNISTATVDTHKAHMLKKLGLKSTTDLIIFAVRNETILKFLSEKNF